MFLGHYGLAFGAKKLAPKVSLVTLFVAVEFVDILWPVMLLAGVEKVRIVPGITEVTPFKFVHYPITHSLLMGFVWGLIVGLAYWFFKRDLRGSVVVGLAVMSHWFLDVIVHIPDLPITPFGNSRAGLGLWNSLPLTLVTETLIFAAGVYIYIRSFKPATRTQRWSLGLLITFLLVVNMINMFGPAPEDSIPALFGTFVVLQVILLSLAHFADTGRFTRSEPSR